MHAIVRGNECALQQWGPREHRCEGGWPRSVVTFWRCVRGSGLNTASGKEKSSAIEEWDPGGKDERLNDANLGRVALGGSMM